MISFFLKTGVCIFSRLSFTVISMSRRGRWNKQSWSVPFFFFVMCSLPRTTDGCVLCESLLPSSSRSRQSPGQRDGVTESDREGDTEDGLVEDGVLFGVRAFSVFSSPLPPRKVRKEKWGFKTIWLLFFPFFRTDGENLIRSPIFVRTVCMEFNTIFLCNMTNCHYERFFTVSPPAPSTCVRCLPKRTIL
jgi:hypothetical protein